MSTYHIEGEPFCLLLQFCDQHLSLFNAPSIDLSDIKIIVNKIVRIKQCNSFIL